MKWFEDSKNALKKIKFPKFNFNNLDIKEEDIIEGEKQKKVKLKKGELYPVTDYKTIKEIFNHSMKNYGNKVFLLDKDNPKDEKFKEFTFKEFGDDCIAFGTSLIKNYRLQNERIVIIGENQYSWYVSYMATLLGVGVAVPVDKELPENEIINVVKRSEASAIIYSDKLSEKISNIEDKIPTVKYFIKMRSDDKLKGRNIGFNEVLKQGKKLLKNKKETTLMDTKIDPDEFKVLIFTSGTTSNAKGVMISNRNLAENVNDVSAYVKLYPEDRLFSVLPLHHTYESSIGFILPFATGSSIAICQGLRYILSNIQETKPSAIIAVPLLIENIYKNIEKSIKKSGKEKTVKSMMVITNRLKSLGIDLKRKVFKEIYDGLGGNLRIIVSAAAPIDKKVCSWFTDLGICFMQGYGLTETAPIAALTPDFDTCPGSAGKAVIHAELKIDHPNENGEGEILIKSTTLMIGYYEDEEATKEVIETNKAGERWFHSGDIGYLNENGFLFITGRIKNVIVTQNGKNIYPEEIEQLLSKVPEIKECMVYGKEEKGEKELTITARVIPNYDEIKKLHGENLKEDEMYQIIWNEIKEVNGKLTTYKAVKSLEIKEDDFIKTSTMKIKRYIEIKEGKIKKVVK